MIINEKITYIPLLELLKSIPNAKRDWKTKNPFEKWCYFYNFPRMVCNILRVPLYRENLKKKHWFGNFVYSYLVGDPALCLYTLFYYQRRGEIEVGLPSTCMMLLCFAVSAKIHLSFERIFEIIKCKHRIYS